MAKSLKSLIRIHSWEVDEKRRKLGELLALVHDLESQAENLENEVAREQEVASASPNVAGFLYGDYAKRVILRRERLADSIARTEELIVEAQAEVTEAYRNLRKYEMAQAARDKRAAQEAAREEQRGLDEIGLQGYIRRKAS